MRFRALAVGAAMAVHACTFMASQSVAAESRFERSLKMLAPADRIAQLCDYTAMARIRKEQNQYRPDRAVANAVSDAKITDDSVVASGGAFRSKGKWYELSYSCRTNPEHLKVVSFVYKVGGEIPSDKWATYGLWE